MRTIAFAIAVLAGTTALAAPAGTDDARLVAGHTDEDPRFVAGAEPDGLLVMSALSPERAVVADPRTGAMRERELPGGTLCHGPLLGIGDRVVVSAARGGRGFALSLPLTLKGPGRRLGEARDFAPSATPGRIWLDRGRVLTEVDLDGRVRARVTLDRARWSGLHAAVDGGFVVDGEYSLVVRGRAIRDAWFVASDRRQVVWCERRCKLVRVDGRSVTPPWRVQAGYPAGFSPDGQRLAVVVRTRGATRLAVRDDGRWRLVPGGRLGDYGASGWSPSGRWLYFADAKDRLKAWRVGTDRTSAVPIDPGGIVMSITVLSGP